MMLWLGSLLVQAANTTDSMQRKAVRARARSELLKAHDLGDNSDFLRVLLVGIPEDRSAPRFSPNAEVYQFIKQGDAAFGQDNYDAATGAYLKALALDPSNYEAADRRADVFTLFRSPAMPSGKCQCQVRETDIV